MEDKEKTTQEPETTPISSAPPAPAAPTAPGGNASVEPVITLPGLETVREPFSVSLPASSSQAPVPPANPASAAPPEKPAAPAKPAAGPAKPNAGGPAKPSVPAKRAASSALPKGAVGGAAPSAFKKYKFFVMAVVFGVVGIGMWGSVKVYQKFFSKSAADSKEKGKEPGSDIVAVNVMEIKYDRFQDILVAVGTIAGGSEIPLRFEVDGIIDLFEFREGDKVRKGDVIARLNQRDSFLKMKRADLELDQYEKLYAIGGVARSRLEEARVAADLARSEMEKTVLRASRDGIVGDKDAEVGEFVTPNKKVATLVSIETVIVRVGIIEKEIDKVFPGQKVMLTVDTYPGVEFNGRVENISPLVQGTSKTLTVEARLDNEGGLLLPGMFARTRIVIFEEENTIAVPNDALEKTQTGHKLYIVTKENKAQARDVEVGYVSSQYSQITKGLSPGEMVVTQKPQDLKDGSAVKIIEVQK
ncbi:MAG: efflux RND transporter periplasmic adaptor subunit [Elusimicrobia bacterium]|nr:efflux RND transporter periplasmic adaptor subunit [Elusimicrobiota bacterium]